MSTILARIKTEIQTQHPSMETTDVAQTLQQVISELEQKYSDLPENLDIDWENISTIGLPHPTLAIVLKKPD